MRPLARSRLFGGILAALAALFFGVLVLLLFGLEHFVKDACQNVVRSVVLSPQKLRKAVLFERDCGATTGVSAHISILPAGFELDDEDVGNIFIARARAKDVVEDMAWRSERELVVRLKREFNMSMVASPIYSEVKVPNPWQVEVRYETP